MAHDQQQEPADAPLSREARKAATRRALLQAAADLFAAQGMERTSLEQIAARVGLTTGAIYRSFRNKEDLIESVVDEYGYISEAAPLYDPALGVAERVAAFGQEVAATLPRVARRDMLLFLEFELYIQRQADKAARERDAQRAWRATEGARFDAATQARGEHLPFSGAEVLQLLNTIARGISWERLRDPDAISPAAAEQLFVLLGQALAAWSDGAERAAP
jgi:AcrR family transcriptional regulator